MKYMKKLMALLAALTLALAMAVPAFAEAAATTYTITINNGTGTYAAYQIFKGDLHDNTLSNIQWGDNVTDAGKEALGKAADRAKELTNTEEAKAFAGAVAPYLGGTAGTVTVDSNGTGTITGLAAGYYLIKNTTVGTDEVYTDYILRVVENVTVQPKSGKPTLDKQIKHNDNGTWGVVGDNQIGDTVEFRTITTVPNVSGYSKYEYVIHDEMSAGLTSNVKTKDDVTIKVNDATDLDKKYYTVTVVGTNKFTVTIDVLQAIQDGEMSAGNELYTYYTGILNENAAVYDVGKQDNKAYLEYSNNPHDESSKTQTPEKVVYDWTFKMEVNKVDGESNAQLTDAKFVLSKKKKPDLGEIRDDGTPSNTKDLINLIDNGDGSYTVAPAGYTGTYVMTAGNITIKGLDDATDYYLYETKAPAGYNRLTDAVKFKITADYDGTGENCTSVTTKVNEDNPKASLSITVKNNKGASLPSTGGIGTTLFYVIGGGLMAVAAVLLVAKKRMNNK
ncbi:SpaH/EbpB family LPXTG-anchored major pilin [uncultured Gemmiger sp.]|uniref:SpaH/EbpB family LPXTG-anchored major pilin n=1 Tax=uncultured Gemmiger sp. TaxID=1623490 RepID=UPI0025E0EF73|nr:SpaH/EbpB family LPXTG-anchored major pilin [uncultured Gemmiger sp.]